MKISTEIMSSNFEMKKFKNISYSFVTTFSCRISMKNKYGFSSTTNLENWEECIRRAAKVARASSEIENFPGLPEKQEYEEVENFSKEIENLGESDIVDLCKECIRSVEEVDKLIKIPELKFFKSKSKVSFLNSNGIIASDEENIVGLRFSLNLGRNSFYEMKNSRKLNFNPKEICKEAAHVLENMKGKRRISSGEYDVIFEYFPAVSLINWILVPSVCADNVQKGRSYFCDKINSSVASEDLNVFDDGTIPYGFATAKFDSEGVKTKRKSIIEKGILKGFLYDFYTAKLEGKESTGNCNSLARRPSIGPTNFVVKSKKEDLKEKFTGLLVKSIGGMHTINPFSGDFSINVDVGFFYENGELKFPIKGCMIFGNFFNILRNLEVGNDLRQDTEIATPSIKLPKLRVIS